jgi:hypothetical protein
MGGPAPGRPPVPASSGESRRDGRLPARTRCRPGPARAPGRAATQRPSGPARSPSRAARNDEGISLTPGSELNAFFNVSFWEHDRLFADRPNFTDPQRAAIARAMSRFLNQFLHRPRAVIHSAGTAEGLVDPCSLLDAARRVFGLADAGSEQQVTPLQPRERCRVT